MIALSMSTLKELQLLATSFLRPPGFGTSLASLCSCQLLMMVENALHGTCIYKNKPTSYVRNYTAELSTGPFLKTALNPTRPAARTVSGICIHKVGCSCTSIALQIEFKVN